WTTLGQLVGLSEILGGDDEVAAHDVFGLGVGSVGDDPLFADDDLAAVLERLTALQLPLLADAANPTHPLLRAGLKLGGGMSRLVLYAAPKQEQVICHGLLLVLTDSSAGCSYNGRPCR